MYTTHAHQNPKMGGSPEMIKAWVNFDGLDCTNGVSGDECIIRDAFNVLRVRAQDIAGGQIQYIIEWKKQFKNENYVAVATSNNVSTKLDVPYLPESIVIQTFTANNFSGPTSRVNVIAIGNLR